MTIISISIHYETMHVSKKRRLAVDDRGTLPTDLVELVLLKVGISEAAIQIQLA